MIAISAILLILLGQIYAQQQQVRVLQRKSPRPTKSVQVYATMLLEHTADILETLPTTTLDSAMMNEQKEGKDGEESGDEGAGGEQDDERFTGRTRTASSTSKTTDMDQSLIDEFIFTSKAAMTQQKSSATHLSVSAAMIAVVLLFFTL